jgi:hypothetical protein
MQGDGSRVNPTSMSGEGGARSATDEGALIDKNLPPPSSRIHKPTDEDMGPHNFGGGEARPLASTPPKKPDARRVEFDDPEAEKRRTARNSKTGRPRGRTRG